MRFYWDMMEGLWTQITVGVIEGITSQQTFFISLSYHHHNNTIAAKAYT